MWHNGLFTTHPELLTDTNAKLKALKGDLTTEEAQITFAQFCRANLHFTVSLLIGVDLYEFQEIMLQGCLHKNYSLAICGRGLGKSFIGAILVILYAIFYPKSSIGICSASFRQSRRVFQTIEDLANAKEGAFLRQCIVGDPKHQSDEWSMKIGSSKVHALPLGAGDKIRGYRFNLMLIDEMLLLTEKVVNEVIQPFMAIQKDPRMRQKVREAEDKLIAAGKITEKDRYQFPANKLVGLTSASYQFEFLYRQYEAFMRLIFGEEAPQDDAPVSHTIFQFSYEMAPPGLYDPTNIAQAKATFTSRQFDREYRAQFVGDSAGYFSALKMQEATVPDGDDPHILLKGRPGKKYVLAVDPNFDDSETSDHFAMAVVELDEENRSGYLVHGYALSKSNIKKRGIYLKYLFSNFNIVYVISDRAGGTRFFNDLNEIGIMDKDILPFEHDFDNANLAEACINSKKSYNAQAGKILHLQHFSTDWIRAANEMLQIKIERKEIKFASKVVLESQRKKILSQKIPYEDLEYTNDEILNASPGIDDLIDYQGYMIDLTKKECSLIEITSTATGHQRFDLPSNLARDNSVDRVRKDSYTALLLGTWGMECYYNLLKTPERQNFGGFIPFFADR